MMFKELKNELKLKDYKSKNEVRWCPGCGDYAILSVVQKTLFELKLLRKNIVFISGIGCSSRFPYYMNTYGMHSIHGRAPTIASGLKIVNPKLSVWVITGDGDALSIGGNHTIHLLRRNLNINVLLFNNRIYGLTKGQYSPTSKKGFKAKSTPFGSLDRPINPLAMALGVGATFVARGLDKNIKHLNLMLKRAYHHKGTSFLEIYQNCVVFNDGVYKKFAEKKDNQAILYLEDKELLLFDEKRKGIGLDKETLEPCIIDLEKNGKINDVLRHDEKDKYGIIAYLLAKVDEDEFPASFGVFRAVEEEVYEDGVVYQKNQIIKEKGLGIFQELLDGKDNWMVKE